MSSSIMYIKFDSEEQFKLITRQVKKLYDHKHKTDARVVRRKQEEYQLLKSLLNKLEPAAVSISLGRMEVPFNRKEIRALQSICLQGTKALEEFIVPGYQERVDSASTEQEKSKLNIYLTRASETKVLYAKLMEKFQS